MSSTSEFVKKMPNGEVLKNKRVLSAMKRIGLISDYTDACSIKSVKIPYGNTSLNMELFPKCNISEIGNVELKSRQDVIDAFGSNRTIKYEGALFTTTCLYGGIQSYLVKVGNVKTSNV